MKILQQVDAIREAVAHYKAQGLTVGFVPTMGALHQGHMSLVSQAMDYCDKTVVSIFVNPTQFNNKNDLINYPRMPEADLAMLEAAGCDLVFLPHETDIYPEDNPKPLDIDLGILDKVMEGQFRPGHFAGVALVVHRLFDAVRPDKAFFGEKDFQQLAVIRLMAAQMNHNIEIIGHPIVREADGLAMSSRNLRLSSEHRNVVPVIYKALSDALKNNHLNPVEVKQLVYNRIAQEALLRTEYVELVNASSLVSISDWTEAGNNGVVMCVAVWAGDIRLIDNIVLR